MFSSRSSVNSPENSASTKFDNSSAGIFRQGMARLDPQEKSAVGDGGLGDFGRQDRPLKAHTSDADFSASTQRKDLIPQRSTAKFLFYAVGTFVSFMVFGIFQERM